MKDIKDHINSLRLELRRGVIVLAVLSQMDSATYGYNLIQRLAEKGLDIEEGTLYPLLRRLKKQGFLVSEWGEGETRPRKYYRISDDGRDVLATLRAEWQETVTVMNKMLEEEHDE